MTEAYWKSLPPAEEIEKWNALYPERELGVRAFEMVEREQRHEHRIRWASIVTSTAVAAGALIGAIYFIGHGNTAAGAALSLSSTGGIVTTYLTRLLPGRSSAQAATPAPSPAEGAA
ncbi:hypothetical protein ABZ930_36895 [Streptomyces sp. NPDC046716]|uniref:hypothetical protein n=1 Tax=Streptomyces sp. NPDC046716 TaxID=3157093 RepID=UPI00340AE2FD